jgi:autotransporter-associated beta strand protein
LVNPGLIGKRFAWLARTARVAASTAAAVSFIAVSIAALTTTAALADGGGASGGGGGQDSATTAGGNGGSAGRNSGDGGGGGGAGSTGGNGGNGGEPSGGGGAGGTTPGASGDAGSNGGGGGGGAHGYVGATLPTTAATGGAGGAGGDAGNFGDGGGAGAGGYGAVVTGSGSLGTLNVSATGGDGGRGGYGNNSGSGGSGGTGLLLTSTAGVSLTVNATITGGQNGAPGNAGDGNSGGLGAVGVGLIGQNVDLIVASKGQIVGGDGGYANAIIFTGGTNTLQLQAGSIINGAVAGAGADTFQLGGSTSATFNVSALGNQYTGFTTFQKIGTSTWTLTGSPGIATPWTISQGTLAISSDAQLGNVSDGLTLDGGTLQFRAGFTTSRGITLTANGGTIDADGNNNIVFSGVIADATAAHGSLTIADSTNAGTVVTLTNADTYTGSTTINSGAGLALSGGGSISDSSTVTNNGKFDISGVSNGGTSIVALGGTNAAATVVLGSNTLTITGDGGSFAGAIGGTGGLTINATGGTQALSGTNGYSGATTITAGTLALIGGGSISASSNVIANGTFDISGLTNGGTAITSLSGAGIVTLGGNTLTLSNASGTFSGGIGGAGGLTLMAGTENLTGASSYNGVTTLAGGMLSLGHATAGTIDAAGTSTLSFGGGALQIAVNGTLGNALDLAATTATITAVTGKTAQLAGPLTIGVNNAAVVFGSATDTGTIVLAPGTISGAALGSLEVAGGTLQAASGNARLGSLTQLAGVTRIDAGATLDFNGNSGAGATIGNLQGKGTLTNSAGASTTIHSGNFAGDITGGGGLTKSSAGILTLTGSNNYTGATTITGGTLDVEGALTGTSSVTVYAGGALTGTGTVDPLTVIFTGGSTFMPGTAGVPGTSTAIVGNLVLSPGATYAVSLNPATSSFANVTGTATLGGATVNAVYANGSYVAKQYTILTALGGVSGTFSSLVNTNLPSGFVAALSYGADDAFLNLSLAFVAPPGSGLSGNQQSVGNAITAFFNSNGSIPLVFGGLTSAGLSQISGEAATGSQQTTFDAMGLFMGLMTDPFAAGRGDGFGASGGAPTGYAATRDANAMFLKAPAAPFEQRWSTWTAGFGGSQTTDGNAALGSNTATSSVYGTAVGADYRVSPDTIAGFAMAGGGTSFNVATSGSGHSDLFQAGAFVRHTAGAAYISAALAYGWQDITTNRTVTVAGFDQLRAQFNANAFSGRLESGYRFVAPWIGGISITPYAAGQFTTFDLPGYAEQAIVGSNIFALAYGSQSTTDARSELGIRTDKSYAMQDAILTLRGRVAWAHDYNPDRAVGATFQTLPGASFVVNGAAQASDSALTTASAELKWTNNWSVAATFEGEFSDVTRSYAGKGVVRYSW